MAKPTRTTSAKARTTRRASATEQASTAATQGDEKERLRAAVCTLPQVPPRIFTPGFDPDRMRAILVSDKKWVNGTRLRYHFLSQSPAAAEVKVVRDAFTQWRNLPIGLEFLEVSDRNEAEIRITFDHSERSSWSAVGRDALARPATIATMNFGWKLSGWTYGRDTALHEIGHALGLPHEHQNPKAGIVWDEPAVLAHFAGAPNYWDDETTRWNILRKISPDTVQGSSWDPDSVMHYEFDAGLIFVPEKYRTEPLVPAGGLSARDIEWVKQFYPAGPDDALPRLEPFESQAFDLEPAQQVNLLVEPSETRWFDFATFGTADTVLVLFEEVTTGAEELQGLRFRAADDDSGTDRNARFGAKLFQGRRYLLRMRLYWAGSSGRAAVMMW